MPGIFDNEGRLIVPGKGGKGIPSEKIKSNKGEIVIGEAYCSNGHSLVSDEKIDGEKALHFIYVNQKSSQETDILLSPVVRKSKKKIIKGEAFKPDEIVKVLCPTCRGELPILLNCECGAPIYLFYIDKQLDHHYGQSFCSRIGCVKASRLRFSSSVLEEFINNYRF